MNSVFHDECEWNLRIRTFAYPFLAVEVESKLTLCGQFYCNYCIEVDLLSNYICKVCALRHNNGDTAY